MQIKAGQLDKNYTIEEGILNFMKSSENFRARIARLNWYDFMTLRMNLGPQAVVCVEGLMLRGVNSLVYVIPDTELKEYEIILMD